MHVRRQSQTACDDANRGHARHDQWSPLLSASRRSMMFFSVDEVSYANFISLFNFRTLALIWKQQHKENFATATIMATFCKSGKTQSIERMTIRIAVGRCCWLKTYSLLIPKQCKNSHNDSLSIDDYIDDNDRRTIGAKKATDNEEWPNKKKCAPRFSHYSSRRLFLLSARCRLNRFRRFTENTNPFRVRQIYSVSHTIRSCNVSFYCVWIWVENIFYASLWFCPRQIRHISCHVNSDEATTKKIEIEYKMPTMRAKLKWREKASPRAIADDLSAGSIDVRGMHVKMGVNMDRTSQIKNKSPSKTTDYFIPFIEHWTARNSASQGK